MNLIDVVRTLVLAEILLPSGIVSDQWKHATIEDLQRQRAALDRLISNAERLRADITEHLERLNRDELPTRAAMPDFTNDRSRKPS